jgi:predicted DNA-binding transcriptional regulator AlpA
MNRRIDPADLLDAREVAAVLGLGSRNSVSVYARRHDDFPQPVVDKADGHMKLWLRADVEAWRRLHPGRRQRRTAAK